MCKYINEHMLTVMEYCKCLYRLEGCLCGGPLHIILDDGNYRDSDIIFCMKECLRNPENEGSDLGLLICRELSNMAYIKRLAFEWLRCGWDGLCVNLGECRTCKIIKEEN